LIVQVKWKVGMEKLHFTKPFTGMVVAIWYSTVYRPPLHIIGHFGDDFNGSDDPTNSVIALKNDG